MKKFFLFVAFAAFSVCSLFAQNSFRGTVTYSVTSTGEEPYNVPAEISTAQIKVYDDKVMTSSKLFTSQTVDNVLVDGLTQYSCMDLSGILTMLSQAGADLSYAGSSKILVKHTYTQQEIDSLTIPVTEGYYIEYVDGETKTIAGQTAKKAVFHVFNDEGDDNPIIFWYADNMGPAVNFLFNGLRGIALEYVLDLGEGRQLTLTATEVKKGKVKEVDMLLPSGYEELSQEELTSLFQEIREEIEYLQDQD